MTDKPNLADARRLAERFTPDSSPWWEKPTAFKVDTEPISAAVVPALLAAVDAVLAACARADERCDYATVTAFDRDLSISAPALLTSEVRAAITAHLDIEPR